MEHRLTCIYQIDARCTNAKRMGDPAPESCPACPYYSGPARGLGDVVATVTKVVGLKTCGGCQKRREALNAAVPNPFKPA